MIKPKFAAYVENMMKYETKKSEKALSYDHKASTLQGPTKVERNRITLSELFKKTKTIDGKTKCNKDSASADEKLHKILQMVHLEALTVAQNTRKYVKKSSAVTNEETEGYRNQHNNILPKDIIIFPYGSISENQTKGKVSHFTYAVKRERWIKSDAEYLILELEKDNRRI